VISLANLEWSECLAVDVGCDAQKQRPEIKQKLATPTVTSQEGVHAHRYLMNYIAAKILA
jgi:hypothetical protein